MSWIVSTQPRKREAMLAAMADVVGHILPLNHQVIASHYLIDESTDAVVYSDTAESVLR